MKVRNYLIYVFIAMLVQSCYKPGKIEVQNNISNVRVVDVYWGDNYISSELLPGESSGKITIDKYADKLPTKHNVSFKMVANERSVYLETEAEYLLDEDQEILIVLTDSTKIANPNK